MAASTPTGPNRDPASINSVAIALAAPVFSNALPTPKAAAIKISTDISTALRVSPTERQPSPTTAEAASREAVIMGNRPVVTVTTKATRIKRAGTAFWYRGGVLLGTSETR